MIGSQHSLLHTFKDAHKLGAHHVTADVNGSSGKVVTSGFGQELCAWDLQTNQQVWQAGGEEMAGSAWALCLYSNGKLLASTSYNGMINVWDAHNNEKVMTFESDGKFGLSIDVSNDDKYVASGHEDGNVYLYSLEMNRLLHALPGQQHRPVRSLAFSPASALLASGSDSSAISVHDIRHGMQVENIMGHTAWVVSVDWDQTGELLLSASSDGCVKVWDVPNRECISTQTENSGSIWSAKWFRSTQKGFLTAGEERALRWYRSAAE